MTQERIDAAAKAFHGAIDDPLSEVNDWLEEISAALAAADQVMFSDEAIERAAVKLWNHDFPSHPIEDISELLEWTRERRLQQVRLLIEALKGGTE